MNFITAEQMPPLALNGGRFQRSDSPQDSLDASISSAMGGPNSATSGGSSGYITCIDFFVPLDLACGPPDDLSYAITPRKAPGSSSSSSATTTNTNNNSNTNNTAAGKPSNSAAASSSSTKGKGGSSGTAKSSAKKTRGLRSLLFGERPTVTPDDFGYVPNIRYLSNTTPTTVAAAAGTPAGGSSSRLGSSEDAPAASSTATAATAADEATAASNNKAAPSPSLFNVPVRSSSGWEDSDTNSDGSSKGPKNYLTISDTKPRAVVDGIVCQRYNLVDREQRQEVVTNLKEICNRLGPRRSRRMVLPALDLLCDFEDTTLLIAQSLPSIFFACEGPTHAHLFVALIYDLCSSPDPKVSAEASQATKTILIESQNAPPPTASSFLDVNNTDGYDDGPASPPSSSPLSGGNGGGGKEVLNHLMPVLFDMAYSPWSACRSSSASLLPLLAKLSSTEEERFECQQTYRYLCEDVDVTVRRSAVASLHEWLAVVPSSEWSRFPLGLIDLFLAEKNHDTIRIKLVEAIVELAGRVGRSLAAQYLTSPTIQLAKDRSWRVRYILASHIGYLYDALSNDVAELMPTVLKLSGDEEVHVRVSTAKQIGLIATLAPSATVETTLVDMVKSLGKDSSPEVRAGVARSVGPVVAACDPSVGRPLILNVLVPLLSDTAVPLVQHTAIMSIAAMAPLMAEKNSGDLYSLVVSQLQTASKSSTWRVRESVANLLHHFTGHLRSPEQFDELMPILLKLINDDSSAVRCAIVNGIPLTVGRLGPAWSVKALTKLFDLLADPQTSKFYQRIQVCTILSSCLPILEKDLVAVWLSPTAQLQQQRQQQRQQQEQAISPTSSIAMLPPPSSSSSVPIVVSSVSSPNAGGGVRSSSSNSSSSGGGVESGVKKDAYYSRLPTEVRNNFNTRTMEVIERLTRDSVLSVREACARLLVTIADEAPLLYTTERDRWAATVASKADSAKDIITKSGIAMSLSGNGNMATMTAATAAAANNNNTVTTNNNGSGVRPVATATLEDHANNPF